MIIRKPKKKRIMGKWIIAFWLLSAAGVLLLMPAEASVAKYQQNQQIAAIDRTGTAAETDSSLDVAKIELGDPVGILTIPSISLKLPIYDGTSDKILENGVGITEGTGDITGGNGKNPLIAGHSGLYKDNLFDDLPSVKKGEKFYIKQFRKIEAAMEQKNNDVFPSEVFRFVKKNSREFVKVLLISYVQTCILPSFATIILSDLIDMSFSLNKKLEFNFKTERGLSRQHNQIVEEYNLKQAKRLKTFKLKQHGKYRFSLKYKRSLIVDE